MNFPFGFNFKTFSLSLIFLSGLFSSAFAQGNEGVATLESVNPPAKTKALVARHLKAISTANYESFKTTYGRPKGWNDTMLLHFEVLTSDRYVTTPDLQQFKANPPLGFNLGVVLEKNFLIIIVPSQTLMNQSNRLPHDILGISAELGAGLRKQGVNPEKSMAFLLNTRSMRIMDAGTWKRQLKS